MDAQKYVAQELPPLPREYVIETSVSPQLNMDWSRASQIRPPEPLPPAKVINKAGAPKESAAKEVLARSSASEIDEALMSARSKDRKWLLSVLLDAKGV